MTVSRITAKAGAMVALCAAIVTVMAFQPGRAEAACYYSTPASTSLPDALGDGEAGLAPEIVRVDTSVDAGCRVAVNPALEFDFLVNGDSVGTFLDTDGNPGTGEPITGGADRAVIVEGGFGGNFGPFLATWNGADFAGLVPLSPLAAGGFIGSVDQLGISAPANVGMQVVTLYEGIYDDYADFAPEPGSAMFRFPVGFSTVPPPPPAVTVPPATNTLGASPAKPKKKAKRCKRGYKRKRGKCVRKKRKRAKRSAVSLYSRREQAAAALEATLAALENRRDR